MGSTKVVLVTGATGQQGRAFIKALYVSSDADTFHVLALTQTPDSASSHRLLASYPAAFLTLVQGDLDSPATVRKIFTDFEEQQGAVKEEKLGDKIWGIFCVLQFPGLGKNTDGEEAQGKLLIDLAREWGAERFVYSSAERCGEAYHEKAILDRMAKVRIESYLKDSASLEWTILRPGFFMENFSGTLGSITIGVLKAGLKPTTKLQLIAVGDIGTVGASVIVNPDPYTKKTLVVVGDTLTMEEIEESYKKGSGKKKMPALNRFLARLLIWMNKFIKDLITDMERVNTTLHTAPSNEPIPVGLALTKQANERMTSFEEWVRQHHGGTGEREKGWNQLKVRDLVMGKS